MKSIHLLQPAIEITNSYKELKDNLSNLGVKTKSIDIMQSSFRGRLVADFPEMDILVIHSRKKIHQLVFHFQYEESLSAEAVKEKNRRLLDHLSQRFGEFLPDEEMKQPGIEQIVKYDSDDCSVWSILYNLDGFHQNIRIVFKPSLRDQKQLKNLPKKIIMYGGIAFFLAMYLTFGFAFRFDWTLLLACLIGSLVFYAVFYLFFIVLNVGSYDPFPKFLDRRLTRFERKFTEVPEAKYIGQVEVGQGITHGMIQANLYFFHTHLLLTTLIRGRVNVIDKFYEDIESVQLVQNMIHIKYGDDIFLDIYMKELNHGEDVLHRFEQKQAQQKAYDRS